MGIKVYHNPRCSKSRLAIQYLEEKGKDFEVKEYLKEIPSKDELKTVLDQLGMSAADLLRKNEADYKAEIKGKDLSEDELIEKMIEFPKLIERPIVINSGKAIVARPTERIEEIL